MNIFELIIAVFNVIFSALISVGVMSTVMLLGGPGWLLAVGGILGFLAWPALLWTWVVHLERREKCTSNASRSTAEATTDPESA